MSSRTSFSTSKKSQEFLTANSFKKVSFSCLIILRIAVRFSELLRHSRSKNEIVSVISSCIVTMQSFVEFTLCRLEINEDAISDRINLMWTHFIIARKHKAQQTLRTTQISENEA